MAKKVILIDDHPVPRGAMQSRIEEILPGYEVIACESKAEGIAAIKQHAGNIHAIMSDERLGRGQNVARGSHLLRELRNGDYGDNVRDIAFAICSGGDMAVLNVPNARHIHKEKYEETKQFLLGALNLSEALPDKDQEARDHNAKMLINLFGNTNEKEVFTFQNPAVQVAERDHYMRDRIEQLREHLREAFNAGMPSKPVLEDLKTALEKRDIYVENDSHANQYSFLRSELKQKVLEGLSVGRTA